MEEFAPARRAAEFAPMDLGIRAAKAICDRFGAVVVDYLAEGTKASISLRIPSRRERFAGAAERYQAALSGVSAVRERTEEVLGQAEQHRRDNLELRTSLAEHRRSLMTARMESRRILDGLGTRGDDRPLGH